MSAVDGRAVSRRRLVEAVTSVDRLRRSAARFGGPANHKEWLHFCLHGGSVDALVNFSLVDDTRAVSAPGAELGRLTVLVRDGRWRGAVERYAAAETRARGGEIDIGLGESSVRFERGRYRIRVNLREHDLAGELELEPLTIPAVASNIQLDRGPPIHWALVPRLRAWGHLDVQGTRHLLDDTLAYHDHNWGYFDWGRDFAWEWCYALPHSADNPWSFAFVRLNNRARTRCYMQGVFLWDGAEPSRIFREAEIEVRHHGYLRPAHVTKVPQVMGLVSPGAVTDVPAEVHVRAAGGGDRVSFVFRSRDLAQVIIPNDTDELGVTIINEVNGDLEVRGEVRGQAVEVRGAAMFEFIRGH